MSDETKLNQKMSDDQSDIESKLRHIALPEYSVDHETLMYQAGWAAAMAESATFHHENGQSNVYSRAWPALAMTFAATTVACLAVMVAPASNESAATSPDIAAAEPGIEQSPMSPEVVEPRIVVDRGKDSPRETALLSRLFGNSRAQLLLNRDAEFQKHLAEASSPQQMRIADPDPHASWKLEAEAPLTPGAALKLF